MAYGSMFGIVAGMMVYISLAELLPSAYRFEKNPAVVTCSMVTRLSSLRAKSCSCLSVMPQVMPHMQQTGARREGFAQHILACVGAVPRWADSRTRPSLSPCLALAAPVPLSTYLLACHPPLLSPECVIRYRAWLSWRSRSSPSRSRGGVQTAHAAVGRHVATTCTARSRFRSRGACIACQRPRPSSGFRRVPIF